MSANPYNCPICGQEGRCYVARGDYWRYACAHRHSWSVTIAEGERVVGP